MGQLRELICRLVWRTKQLTLPTGNNVVFVSCFVVQPAQWRHDNQTDDRYYSSALTKVACGNKWFKNAASQLTRGNLGSVCTSIQSLPSADMHRLASEMSAIVLRCCIHDTHNTRLRLQSVRTWGACARYRASSGQAPSNVWTKVWSGACATVSSPHFEGLEGKIIPSKDMHNSASNAFMHVHWYLSPSMMSLR